MNIDARGIKESSTVSRNWKNFCRAEPAGPRIKASRVSSSFPPPPPLSFFPPDREAKKEGFSRATSDDDCDREDFNKLPKRSADWRLLLFSSDKRPYFVSRLFFSRKTSAYFSTDRRKILDISVVFRFELETSNSTRWKSFIFDRNNNIHKQIYVINKLYRLL